MHGAGQIRRPQPGQQVGVVALAGCPVAGGLADQQQVQLRVAAAQAGQRPHHEVLALAVVEAANQTQQHGAHGQRQAEAGAGLRLGQVGVSELLQLDAQRHHVQAVGGQPGLSQHLARQARQRRQPGRQRPVAQRVHEATLGHAQLHVLLVNQLQGRCIKRFAEHGQAQVAVARDE